jgi:CRISPR-associated protein Cas1
VLHADYRKQEPLVYDFIEEFRQPVVDRTVLTMLHHKQVDPSYFVVAADGCRINPEFKREYARAVLARLDAQYEYRGQNMPLSVAINAQARYLAAALLKQKAYRPFVYR